jgi:hypothetical protein
MALVECSQRLIRAVSFVPHLRRVDLHEGLLRMTVEEIMIEKFDLPLSIALADGPGEESRLCSVLDLFFQFVTCFRS